MPLLKPGEPWLHTAARPADRQWLAGWPWPVTLAARAAVAQAAPPLARPCWLSSLQTALPAGSAAGNTGTGCRGPASVSGLSTCPLSVPGQSWRGEGLAGRAETHAVAWLFSGPETPQLVLKEEGSAPPLRPLPPVAIYWLFKGFKSARCLPSTSHVNLPSCLVLSCIPF